MQINIREVDIFFMSYGERNANANWMNLLTKAPWARWVKDVKGFDEVHRECARQSTTDWFVTVDADTIMYESFLDVSVKIEEGKPRNFCWASLNKLNGLRYGNGGLKLWHKPFAENMAFHEYGSGIDFCWDPDYRSIQEVFSNVVINSSPIQAFRAGYREGVKLSRFDGRRIAPGQLTRLPKQTLARLMAWTSRGLDVENGVWAILGARRGLLDNAVNSVSNHQLGDYEYIDAIMETYSFPLQSIDDIGKELAKHLPFKLILFTPEQCRFIREMYEGS